ncbi:MAG: hypothetical protein JST58_10355 [Bacteroidetes bacterium]|nr:hypothetical protein [Bacteroidota bacterium]
MLQLLGHLHPVLVHLPIGILLLACLFLWQSRKEKYQQLRPAIHITLLIGMISAIVSCITGYLLSQSGDYDQDAVNLHQWMGISVAVVSVAIYYSNFKTRFKKWQLPLALLLLILIFSTGHLGGSITHGSDYLSQPLEEMFGNDTLATFKRKPIANVPEALVYADIVEPIFQEKCYSCHGSKKQKGRLRMDKPEMLMKGGKDGVVIISGNSAKSELIKRILLPREDEHHMAPKEKAQLTEQEINLLKWWIDNGTDFTKKVKDLPQTDQIKPALMALSNIPADTKNLSDVPSNPVDKADENAVDQLRNKGAIVMPVAQNSNWLSVIFNLGNGSVSDSVMRLLLPLKKQLIWLKLSNNPINDSSLAIIGQCSQLVKLQLDHSNISDNGMVNLKNLQQLQSLNLVGTAISENGLVKLKGLKNLHALYLYQTNINKANWGKLQQDFPKTTIDSGGYQVPILHSDTSLVKPAPTK